LLDIDPLGLLTDDIGLLAGPLAVGCFYIVVGFGPTYELDINYFDAC
jgi:hypothetical protein